MTERCSHPYPLCAVMARIESVSGHPTVAVGVNTTMSETTESDEVDAEIEQDGVFIEIDEDDPFAALQLQAMTDDGANGIVGGIEAEPGRYELKKVDDV